MAAARTRVEHDSMGEVVVAADALWGAQTQRALENFRISGEPMPAELIRAVAMIKAEAARVNGRRRDVPAVSPALGRAIANAADAVAAGAHTDAFPIDVFQTGSGTSTNMNVNEVVARLAHTATGLTVHPNDHVNASQSSNDVIPSAIRIAAALAVVDDLLPALDAFERTLRRSARRFTDVVKAGRTHLMDATPVTFGQQLRGYAVQIHDAAQRVRDTLERLGQLPLGGTAVGTGINAPKGFARATIAALAERTGLPLVEAPDHFAVQGGQDVLVELSGQLRTVAVALLKIANDLRWMASGPAAGLGEIHLPDLQPGSSIMPGKVNPVIPEVVAQVVAQVVGNDATVAFAGTQGSFELNTYLPVMARNLLESIRLLAAATAALDGRCVAGITVDRDRTRRYAEASSAVVTALAPTIGYEAAAAAVHEATTSGRPLREVVLERKLVDPADIDGLLDVRAMTRGGISAG